MDNSDLNKKIKLIALDLDGTVLTDEKTITPRTAKAIADAARCGIEVVPVTGRPLSGIPEDLLKIPGIRYMITSNGAITAKLSGTEKFSFSGAPAACSAVTEYNCLRSEFLDRASAESMIGLCLERALTFNIFIDGIGYALPDSCSRLIERFTGTPLDDYVRKSRCPVNDIPSLMHEKGSRVENIWIKRLIP